MELPSVEEKWSGVVVEVVIGAKAEDGGTRTSVVKVGGHKTLPFLRFESDIMPKPVIAMEVIDKEPEDWPAHLSEPFGDVLKSPVDWASKCVEEYGAEMICLRLVSTHPDFGDTSPDDAAKTARKVLESVGVPLIIWDSGDDAKDNEVMPVVSQAVKGEKCLLASAREDNYKTITAACLADGHPLVTDSPLDINIAKQVNILVSEMGLPFDRIVMFQQTGGLGYGIEYAYSIQERTRIAALSGDKLMAMPVLLTVGQESWRAKESKATAEDAPEWGDEKPRSQLWEVITATTLMLAGADIAVMRHPGAVKQLQKVVSEIYG